MPDVPPNSPTPRNWAHGSTGSCRPSPPTAWTAIRSPGFPTPAIRQRCRPQRVSKLSADESKLLVFEGNPLFVAEADRAKVDYFILDTEKTEDVGDVKLQILNATGYAAVPASKLLLAAEAGAPLKDEDRVEYAAVEEMSRRVIAYGPLRGLGAYNIGNDYYNADMNYKMIRQAIQTLNPSK